MSLSLESLLVAVAAAVAIGGTIYVVRRLRQRPLVSRRPAPVDTDEPVISLVLLQARPREVYADWLRETAERVFGVSFSMNDQEERPQHFIVGDGDPLYLLHCHGCFFVVNNVAQPYVEDPELFLADPAAYVRDFPERRVRQAIERHRSWTSVDLIYRGGSMSLSQAYRWMGRLIASLADSDTLAMASLEDDRINVWDPQLERRLLSGEHPQSAVKDLHHGSLLDACQDDPAMRRAAQEARRRWEEFVRAFETRMEGEEYLVRAPVRVGDSIEQLWLEVGAIENGIVYGLLRDGDGGVPRHARVRVREEEISDWIFATPLRTAGGFTRGILPDAGNRGP